MDELVYFYENAWGGQSAILNDANYNVVGAVELSAGAHIHYQYYPYGRYLRLYDQGYESEPRISSTPENFYTEYVHGGSNNPPFRLNIGFGGHILDPETNAWHMRARNMPIRLSRFSSPDPNGTAIILTTALGQMGQGPMVNAHFSPMLQYTDGLGPYTPFQSNPLTNSDPTGLFTYVELLSTTAIQATMGGMINGIVSKFAGKDFWAGFAEGAIGGAVGGGAGYAFQAARAGFFGTAVLGRFVEGAVEDGVTSFYNGDDVKDELVNALYGGGMSVATGGLFSLKARNIEAVQTLGAVHPSGRPMRRGSIRPSFGPGSFSDDLAKYWGLRTPPPGYHAHHVLPLSHAPEFRAAGLEPDDVMFGAWWEAGDHLRNAREYDDLWKDFFERNYNPTIDQILHVAREFSGKLKIKVAF